MKINVQMAGSEAESRKFANASWLMGCKIAK